MSKRSGVGHQPTPLLFLETNAIKVMYYKTVSCLHAVYAIIYSHQPSYIHSMYLQLSYGDFYETIQTACGAFFGYSRHR